MEYDLKISKVEYISNLWSDRPQILYLSFGDKTNIEYCFKGQLRAPYQKLIWLKMKTTFNEEDLKILKMEYLSNPRLYLHQILNLKIAQNLLF